MRKLALMALMCVVSSQCVFGTDTVEMKTGERVEGLFKQATVAGVVIEVGGQSITMPLDKVRAIYFGLAKSTAASPSPAQSGEVLNALRALQSVTESTVSFRDYAPRVLDAKIKVDEYMRASGNDPAELRGAIGLAMREYELALRVWDADFPSHGGSATWEKIEATLDPDIVRTCPAVRDLLRSLRLGVAMRDLDVPDAPVAGQQAAYTPLWKCAAVQLAEAERLLARH